MSPQQIEDELELAQEMGRWLSDEERDQRDAQKSEQKLALERDQRVRQRLIVLAGVFLLIPPLWPVAAGLAVYLLFPQTFRRLVLLAGGSLLVLVTLGISALALGIALLWILLT